MQEACGMASLSFHKQCDSEAQRFHHNPHWIHFL
uniref:Uncharacterized protein n=1 Tax=Rhizophora mucronata TaxID=61149 RepID=A0A2P2NG05_RHIMU